MPTAVRLEGISERTGDIVLTCSGGQAGGQVSGNIVLSLNTSVANHILADGSTDVTLAVNYGSGTTTFSARPYSNNAVAFNGVLFTTPQGPAELRFANLRGNASQTAVSSITSAITASLSFTGAGLALPASTFIVAYPQRGLYATAGTRLVCDQYGSPLADPVTMQNLLTYSASATTRATEGFASAFAPLGDSASLRADSGTRIVLRYSGFVSGARLFAPDAVAGSNADVPTGTGDFGTPASGGQYTPGRKQLLLIRVLGADVYGAGGRLAMATPAATAQFNSASEVTLTNGAGSAVYEVVDADPNVQESAQFPAFLGLAANSGASSVETALRVNLGPISAVATMSATAPVPRFIDIAPTSDCPLVGDCGASYFPRLQVATTSLTMTAPQGQSVTQYIPIQNGGAGALRWTASVTPVSAASWLTLSPPQGVNNSTLRVDAITKGLPVGDYSATVTIDAGASAGSKSIPVTLTVTAPIPPTPSIGAIVNAASADETRLTAGSLATIYGAHLIGKAAGVTFNGLDATMLYDSESQINLQVPIGLAGRATATAIVTVDGVSSLPFAVTLADSAPAIFSHGVLNQNYDPNGASAPAAAGTVVQVFATGLPATGVITAKIHDRAVPTPEYGGAAPGFPGLQQVNIRVPGDLPTMQTWVYVCGGLTAEQQSCSAPAMIWIAAK